MPEPIFRLNEALKGRYTIERELGEGGMATVYLARDERHDRRVAIKVLKPDLAAVVGAERFLAEITTTANLQHPHILPLFDSGEADGLLFYVMPFVDGESLRDRLQRENQLPIEESVSIATRIASALQAAHDRGVIHRDIKPANILLAGGEPLVADFGIALAVQAAGGRLTETGLSLGTPYYMSPEQASADRAPDARSDVYSLGCVLYEMLAGGPPFQGATAQAVLGKILMGSAPDVREERRATPPHVAAAIACALERIPADRFASATAFARALGDPGFRHGPAPASTSGGVSSVWRHATLGLGAVVVALAGFGASTVLRDGGDAETTPLVREASIILPDSTPLAFIGSGPLGVGMKAFAVSPDGGTLVFAGQSDGTTRLYARPLDASSTRQLPGTEGAYAPFFSPNGQWVGYFAGPNLMKTRLDGGAPVAVAAFTLPYGGVWLPDDRIVVAADEGGELVSIPASGGVPNRVVHRGGSLVFPQALPDGENVLMSSASNRIALVSIDSGAVRWLTTDGWTGEPSSAGTEVLGTHPRFVKPGHLTFIAPDGSLMAMPYDASDHTVLGDPAPVLSGLRVESVWGAGQLEVAADGALIYARGENARNTWLAWRDARGTVDTLFAFGRANYGELDLSPDGSRLVVWACSLTGVCEWNLLSVAEGLRAPLGEGGDPRWWDDQRLVDPGGSAGDSGGVRSELFPADNRLAADRLEGQAILDVARDGYFVASASDGTLSIGVRDELPASLRETQLRYADGWGYALGPGGAWLAYTSTTLEDGEYQVYLARTTPPYERIRISPQGGEEPAWEPDGNLIYREGNRWMRVAAPGPTGRPGAARFLFEGPYVNVLGRSHDVAPDGRHLLVVAPPEGSLSELTLVTGWAQRLSTIAPSR